MIAKRTSLYDTTTLFALYYILTAATPLYAAPSLTLKTEAAQSTVTAIITGTEFPAITAMTIICSYNPDDINLADAIIYSPLSSTSIGALLRTTPDTSLLITVTATSSISPPDETPLVTLEIPTLSTPTGAPDIHLAEAKYTDVNGDTHTAEITSTEVFHFRTPVAPCITQNHRTLPSAFCLPNGRKMNKTISHLSVNTVILQRTTGNRTAARIVKLR